MLPRMLVYIPTPCVQRVGSARLFKVVVDCLMLTGRRLEQDCMQTAYTPLGTEIARVALLAHRATALMREPPKLIYLRSWCERHTSSALLRDSPGALLLETTALTQDIHTESRNRQEGCSFKITKKQYYPLERT